MRTDPTRTRLLACVYVIRTRERRSRIDRNVPVNTGFPLFPASLSRFVTKYDTLHLNAVFDTMNVRYWRA